MSWSLEILNNTEEPSALRIEISLLDAAGRTIHSKASHGLVVPAASTLDFEDEVVLSEADGRAFRSIGAAVGVLQLIETVAASAPAQDPVRAAIEYFPMLDCENFVREKLRSPGSAVFAPRKDQAVDGEGRGPYTVVGSVDSQNGFGALLRNHYVCTVSYEGSKVYLDDLQFVPHSR